MRTVAASAVSEKELQKRLLQKGASQEDAEETVEWLRELHLLSDADTAAQLVRSAAAKGYGEARIKNILYEKGIPKELWDAALDELPEMSRGALEALRQPLEERQVTISRVSGAVTYPAEFMLVCAMNPCKCGWYGDPSGRCRCSQRDVDNYRSRISGPLLDRIDIVVEVPSVHFEDLRERAEAEPSASVKQRVNAARDVQNRRFGSGGMCNARMGPEEMRRYCHLSEECAELMKGAFETMGLTARSYDRILKVARTVADLDGSEDIQPQHIAEAIQYRAVNLGNR